MARKDSSGTVSSEIIATIDLLPTIAKLAGQTIPQDRIIDGQDASDILLGKAKAKPPRVSLLRKRWHTKGKWKLVRYRVKADRFVGVV